MTTATSPTLDYYRVLEVSPTATAEEIRSSFKRLVIEWHPDKNPQRRAQSERRVRELIEAYDVLGDARSREEFDRRRAAVRARAGGPSADGEEPEPFFFRRTDPRSRAMLVLWYLVQRQPQAAFDLLRDMESARGRSFLEDHLEARDYLDCLFLLGEVHLSRREYVAAAARLSAFWRHESGKKFPRHYLTQVVDLLKDLWLNKLPRVAGADDALTGLCDAASLRLSYVEEAIRLRRTAEILLSAGRAEEARVVVDRAERLYPESKDFRRLRSRVLAACGRRSKAGRG